MTRLDITKTPKSYVGRAFVRSESGRIAALHDASGAFFAQYPAMHAQGSAQCGRSSSESGSRLGETLGL